MRRAAHDDVPAMVEMFEAMHAESRYSRFPALLSKVEGFLHSVIADRRAIVLVSGDPLCGMFIGWVDEFWWGPALESCDLLLYVKKESRGGLHAVRLIKGYLEVAEQMGVSDIKVGASTGISPERTYRFFERMGFQEFARSFAVGESETVH